MDGDAFSGLAPFLRVTPELQLICRFGDQWRADHARESGDWAPFHIITEGQCRLDVGSARYLLSAGDVALLPHGSPHLIHSLTSMPKVEERYSHRLHNGIVVRTNGEPPDTQLVCGRLRFETLRNNMVLAALPTVIVVKQADGQDAGRLRTLIEAMTAELEADDLGSGSVAMTLASAILMIVLRAFFNGNATAPGLLSLLADPKTGRVMLAVFQRIDHPWALDELANIANTSRATLVRAFQRAVGMAPLAFLIELRLDLARRRVRLEKTPLARIAEETGYLSQSAFHRAFQRRFGIAPGAYRKTA
ncbi:AraC family transcriptional regulator [Asticcacaulis sp. EMRT-3]|uniref:AraC family transcriptional regulator n=1 Tax=Asticcacaulis sp. EMRT-3 TaxID=3040349 RepID=UPI0024AE8FC0|nr:AraC family transcriptional regulator [Asticcacaulis sp. EMRT-3]MDI7776477.1 AraC family transcriptional regulator [Asticcacaulis sp. EMRT-3]